jgi:hypothetical protein
MVGNLFSEQYAAEMVRPMPIITVGRTVSAISNIRNEVSP